MGHAQPLHSYVNEEHFDDTQHIIIALDTSGRILVLNADNGNDTVWPPVYNSQLRNLLTATAVRPDGGPIQLSAAYTLLAAETDRHQVYPGRQVTLVRAPRSTSMSQWWEDRVSSLHPHLFTEWANATTLVHHLYYAHQQRALAGAVAQVVRAAGFEVTDPHAAVRPPCSQSPPTDACLILWPQRSQPSDTTALSAVDDTSGLSLPSQTPSRPANGKVCVSGGIPHSRTVRGNVSFALTRDATAPSAAP